MDESAPAARAERGAAVRTGRTFRILPAPGAGRAVLAATPWLRLAAGWALAYSVGAASAWAVMALGWWDAGGQWERDMLAAAQATVSPALDVVMLTLPFAGTNYSLAPLIAIAAIVLWRRGYASVALHLAIVQAGSWMLNPSLKFSFPRERPTLFEARGQHAFPAFPSGHAIAVVGVLLTVAYLIDRCGLGKWGYWVVGAFFILNSYSRIYLSVHWPTDVIAGGLVGAVWLAWTIRALEPLHARAAEEGAGGGNVR